MEMIREMQNKTFIVLCLLLFATGCTTPVLNFSSKKVEKNTAVNVEEKAVVENSVADSKSNIEVEETKEVEETGVSFADENIKFPELEESETAKTVVEVEENPSPEANEKTAPAENNKKTEARKIEGILVSVNNTSSKFGTENVVGENIAAASPGKNDISAEFSVETDGNRNRMAGEKNSLMDLTDKVIKARNGNIENDHFIEAAFTQLGKERLSDADRVYLNMLRASFLLERNRKGEVVQVLEAIDIEINQLRPFQLFHACFVDSVKSFGDFKQKKTPVFYDGDDIVVYSEAINFSCEKNETDRVYDTELEIRATIMDKDKKMVLFEYAPCVLKRSAESRFKDLFLTLNLKLDIMTLPNAGPGTEYILKLQVEDALSSKKDKVSIVDERLLRFKIGTE